MVGLPGLLLTVLMFTIKEPPRKGATGTGASIPVRDVLKYFGSKARAYSSICIGVSMNAALGFGSVIFLPFFFVRYHQMAPADVGITFGLISLVTGPLGLLFGGWLADRLYKKGRKDAHILALMAAPLGFAIPSFTLPFIQDTTTAWVVLAFSNFFINSPSGVAYASLQIITPNQMRGQIISIYVMCTSIIGYGAGPFALGFFTDYIFGDEMKLNLSFLLLALITVPVGIGTFLWGRKAYAKAVEEEEARLKAIGG
ncbi:MFS transporter [Kordiimonas gwangyangensis]|nr:MFS transporter [Kordiimonas gwangyangensis]